MRGLVSLLGLEQFHFARGHDCLQSAADAKLAQDAADVRLDRPRRDVQAPADELVRQALAEQREHVSLARCEMDLALAGPPHAVRHECETPGLEIHGCLWDG